MSFIDDHLQTAKGHVKYVKQTPLVQKHMEDAYIEQVNSGVLPTEAARNAGYPSHAIRRPRKHIETPELRARMQESLIRKRVTLDAVADTVAKGMKAKVLSVTKHGVEETELPDHAERRKSAEVAARLWGLGERVSNIEGGSTITLTLAGPLAERIAARMGATGEHNVVTLNTDDV